MVIMDGYHGNCLTTTLATGIFAIKTCEVIGRLSGNVILIIAVSNLNFFLLSNHPSNSPFCDKNGRKRMKF